MKKIFCLITIFYTVLLVSAQSSTGSFVMFPDGSLFGSAFKPKIAFYQDTDPIIKNFFILSVAKNDGYADFDENSRMLIKFEDGSKFTLPILAGVESRDFSYISNISVYNVLTMYRLDDQILEKIRNYESIIKIRIVYTNGDIDDYDIDESYQYKFIRKLNNSYNEVIEDNSQMKRNMNDDYF